MTRFTTTEARVDPIVVINDALQTPLIVYRYEAFGSF